jgi:hypothetical protein
MSLVLSLFSNWKNGMREIRQVEELEVFLRWEKKGFSKYTSLLNKPTMSVNLTMKGVLRVRMNTALHRCAILQSIKHNDAKERKKEKWIENFVIMKSSKISNFTLLHLSSYTGKMGA